MTLPTVSALTLARGREAHLRNVIEGLRRQSHPPVELVIGVMQDDLYDLPDTPFPVRQIVVAGDELPLARARNAVAGAARGEVLAFLDVDCIPRAACLEDYARVAAPGRGLLMGEVMYLPKGATDGAWSDATFAPIAERHCDRQPAPAKPMRECDDYRCFWSLNFAMHRDDWAASGGFDERFVGYGGEDTDFGKTLDHLGIPIWWVRGAGVWHQYHPHCMPPVHHLASVVRNAELFADKWGFRTMEHWLAAFRRMGLVADTPEGLAILREPDAGDIAFCAQQEDRAYASSGWVLRRLRARDGDLEGTPEAEAEGLVRPAAVAAE
ncbi:MAG: glycosyltransferase family 2 protein [Shimia sp.]